MRYPCSKNISEKINLNSAMCHIPTDREKVWPFFDILLDAIPCGDPQISPLYLCSRQPLLSILNRDLPGKISLFQSLISRHSIVQILGGAFFCQILGISSLPCLRRKSTQREIALPEEISRPIFILRRQEGIGRSFH